MKKFITFFAFLLVAVTLYSQEISGTVLNSDYFLLKSKKQYTTGRILLGVGTTMAIVGLIGFNENFVVFGPGGDSQKADIYGSIFAAGLVMDMVSIPAFVSASQNKRKAFMVKIDHQNLLPPDNRMLAFQQYFIPSVTLRLAF